MFATAHEDGHQKLGLDRDGLTAAGISLVGAGHDGALALTRDAARCRALLSIAANRSVAPDEILPTLARFPTRWNHLVDQKSRQLNELSKSSSPNRFPLRRDLL